MHMTRAPQGAASLHHEMPPAPMKRNSQAPPQTCTQHHFPSMNSSTESASPELQTGTYLRFFEAQQWAYHKKQGLIFHRKNFGLQTSWLGTSISKSPRQIHGNNKYPNDCRSTEGESAMTYTHTHTYIYTFIHINT